MTIKGLSRSISILIELCTLCPCDKTDAPHGDICCFCSLSFCCSLMPGNYDDYDDERVVVRFARPPLANCSGCHTPSPGPSASIADCQHDNDNHAEEMWQF